MKSKALLTAVFLLAGLTMYAFSEREIIQKDLERLGIKQEIIDQTIKIEDEIGDRILVGSGRRYISSLETIFKRDSRNFIVANMINTYNSRHDKEAYKKNKRTVDLYIKYVPYEYEKLSASYVYNMMTGNRKAAQEDLRKLHEKYGESWISEWMPAGRSETTEEERRRVKRAAEKMAVEKKDIESGISDEDFYYIITIYNGLVVKELSEKGSWQKAVSYFIDNVAGQDVKERIIGRFSRTLMNQFEMVLSINEKIDEKNAKINEEKIKNTKMYKILYSE